MSYTLKNIQITIGEIVITGDSATVKTDADISIKGPHDFVDILRNAVKETDETIVEKLEILINNQFGKQVYLLENLLDLLADMNKKMPDLNLKNLAFKMANANWQSSDLTEISSKMVPGISESKAKTGDSKKGIDCGNEFRPTSNVQKRCVDCKNIKLQPKNPKTVIKPEEKKKFDYTSKNCGFCGKDFIPWRHNQKLCSDCKTNNTSHKSIAFISGENKIVRVPKKCIQCGKEFIWERSPSEKTCSNTCRSEHNKTYTKKYNKEWILRHKTKRIEPNKINPVTGRPNTNNPFN